MNIVIVDTVDSKNPQDAKAAAYRIKSLYPLAKVTCVIHEQITYVKLQQRKGGRK